MNCKVPNLILFLSIIKPLTRFRWIDEILSTHFGLIVTLCILYFFVVEFSFNLSGLLCKYFLNCSFISD